jgi:hypothetical protein
MQMPRGRLTGIKTQGSIIIVPSVRATKICLKFSMTFKIVKGFPAVEAAVHGFAGGGTKLADQFRVKGIAAGALHRFLTEHICSTELLFWIGRGYTEGF